MNLTRIISRTVPTILLLLLCRAAHAQVNSGSNGSDGAFNPTTNIVINMADHPDGIYQYTSVNIPTNVTVTFIPNANNTPVVWLIQSNALIYGVVDVSGGNGSTTSIGEGGPGAFRGGSSATDGYGPGGGSRGLSDNAGNASFGTIGGQFSGQGGSQAAPGSIYGNAFLLPLIGGSGGGGLQVSAPSIGASGGGGGGAILIASSQTIEIQGSIISNGGNGGNPSGNFYNLPGSGGGSGGAIRLVGNRVMGAGRLSAVGGQTSFANSYWCGCWWRDNAGNGRLRIDTLQNDYNGPAVGEFSAGFQPIIISTPGQISQLSVTSVGGVPISASPSGQLATPDAILSAQQNNPIPIVVHCSNIPLNTQITVSVKPANGAAVSATGYNNTGTLASSTATVLLNMPRGGGIIYATAAN